MLMKKGLIAAVVSCGLMLSSLVAGATAQQIIIDGSAVDVPEDMGYIQERDDRTFVPVRFVMENLGCEVNYNEVQQSATITDANGVSYFMMNDSAQLFVLPNIGVPKAFTMDTKIFIDGDRMYIPIRFLAEAIGYTVDWDDETKTVILIMEDESL